MDPGLFGTGTGKEGRMYRDDIIILSFATRKVLPPKPPGTCYCYQNRSGGGGGGGTAFEREHFLA